MKLLCRIVLVVFVGLGFWGAYAKPSKVKSDEKFYRLLEKSPFTVALFYAGTKDGEEYEDKLDDLRDTFDDIEDADFYEDGDVKFIEVNVERKDLHKLAREYDIKKFPAILLFKHGLQVKRDGKPVALFGFTERTEVDNFINLYLGEDIEEYLEEKAERRERRREEGPSVRPYINFGTGPYWYDPYYYDYPYLGYPYGYYGRPGVSFGFGVGI